MAYQMDFLFARPDGYEELVERVESNPRFVFEVRQEDRIDKRTRKAKHRGWARIQHKKYNRTITLRKAGGGCEAELGGDATPEFTGAWISWLVRNAGDLIYGINLRLRD